MYKLIFFLLFTVNIMEEVYTTCPNRPSEMINAEIYCEEEVKDGILDKIETKAKSFFNRAKLELGLKVDNTAEPRKCEHYLCIFERLQMINQLNLPDLSLIQKWIDNSSIGEEVAPALNKHVSDCFKLLATSAINVQNTCETASRLMMCMSANEKCEIFKFP